MAKSLKEFVLCTACCSVGLWLLVNPSVLSTLICGVLWFVILFSVILRMKNSKSQRLELGIFVFFQVSYCVMMLVPDRESNSPRLMGNEITSATLRQSFELVTGIESFKGQSETKLHFVESGKRSVERSVSSVPGPELVQEEHQEFLQLVDEIFSDAAVVDEAAYPINLSGTGTFEQMRLAFANYMYVGHMIVSALLGFLGCRTVSTIRFLRERYEKLQKFLLTEK